MKEVCFFTTYDSRAREMAQGMINSVKHWYPDIPMEALEIDIQDESGHFDVFNFCYAYLRHGLKLLDEYKRIIYIDPDSVMCNLCPDLFKDYDLGVVRNNTGRGPEGGGRREDVYINAGLSVCTNKDVWQERINEYEKRMNQGRNCLNEQNALNWTYHNTKYNAKLLEFNDRSYGISSLDHYQGIELRDKEGNVCLDKETMTKDTELYLPSNKKLCIFHAAGTYWKTGTKINFDFITNELARETMKGYTC